MSVDAETMTEKVAVLNLLAIDGIGSGTVLRLVEHLKSASAVFTATDAQLAKVPRMSATLLARIHAARLDGQIGRERLEKAQESGVEVRTFWDQDYPPLLKELEFDAPAVLFIRGNLPAATKRLAVVGTRSATAYGKRMTQDLIRGLRGSGVTIVSGLASGIDGFAHEAALETGLATEAIFGCGVDRIYPPVHTGLAHRILASDGALVSEYALGIAPDRHHFPQRNRIIAGLARATLVVEAGDRSGALITALLSGEYNREVAAVPGAVTNPKVAGCHRLIKTGAALIESSEDILQLLQLRASSTPKAKQESLALNETETAFYGLLDASEAQHIDALAEKLSLPVGEALGQLLLLELKGAVKQLPGKYFVRA